MKSEKAEFLQVVVDPQHFHPFIGNTHPPRPEPFIDYLLWRTLQQGGTGIGKKITGVDIFAKGELTN